MEQVNIKPFKAIAIFFLLAVHLPGAADEGKGGVLPSEFASNTVCPKPDVSITAFGIKVNDSGFFANPIRHAVDAVRLQPHPIANAQLHGLRLRQQGAERGGDGLRCACVMWCFFILSYKRRLTIRPRLEPFLLQFHLNSP